jgi:hypothetical protein
MRHFLYFSRIQYPAAELPPHLSSRLNRLPIHNLAAANLAV